MRKELHLISRMVLILALLFVHGQSIFAQSEAKQFVNGQYLYTVLSEPEDEKPGTVSIGFYFDPDNENVNTNVDLNIPETVIQDGNTYTVTEISGSGFTRHNESGFIGMQNVKSLSIPKTITEIGEYAFCNISFEAGSSELKLPEGLKTIRKGAFECQEDDKILKEGQFSGTLTIPSTVTTIEMYAFRGCRKLTGALVIPDSVNTLGVCAFYNCSGFTSFEMPDNFDEIPDGVFRGCSGLTNELKISTKIKKIGEEAFAYCDKLTGNPKFAKDLDFIGKEAFAGCKSLTGNLVLPTNLQTLGAGCFRACSGLTGELTIPNSITSIEDQVFKDCTGLKGTLTIPAGVTKIGDNAFENCSGLTGTLPAFTAITSIGKEAFLNCTGIGGDIAFPSTLTTIGTSAFEKTALRIVSIPNSVTAIGDKAFDGCSNITHISFPSNLSSLGSNCMSCTELTIPYLSGGTYAAQQADTVYYMPNALPTSDDFINNSTMKKLCLKPSLYKTCNEQLQGKSYEVTDKVSITFPEGKEYITLCRDFDVDLAKVNESLPEGVEPLKAYIVSDYNAAENLLTMQEVTYIPSRLRANEAEYKGMEKYVGIVLKGKPGYTYYATMGEKDYGQKSGQEILKDQLPTADKPSLAGASQPKIVNPEETEYGETYKTYGLKDGKFLVYSQEGVIAYNKAYLRMPQTSNAEAKPMLLMQFQDMNGTTSVDKVVVPDNLFGDGAIYNLQGMKVKELVKGQIYIKNGQKIMIK